ncbi:hypothetical protein NSIN_20114 [Nitrosotalea sinensis]|uniref:Uncharacterized protein n=1 Tax=Nitrosotalea sinensis TaxID=1499975 RepID=A0A2H1EFC8_9ARCH|nr:hypothetical protein [Candidatus Nitrosotalea sinensis]SHO43600.1 hypothetical protein NSIN_20114 [Candidatus Nitrosotalea sinensis]
MSKELRIKKGDVELAIHFDTKDQLKERLEDYEEISKIVEERLGVSFESKKAIRKDLEGICDFENNHIVLIKSPSSKVKKVCLVLHAYGPSGATLEEITLSSGVTNPSRNVINNTANKKYFRRLVQGRYALSDKGISFVTDEILPELKGGNNGTN